jgi:dephospho-CoA kinase
LKVGLTGGIASGKSVVGEMFATLGAHLIQADSIAHQLMQPGEPVYKQVIEHFGSVILNRDSTINRPKLAEAAFGHPERGGTSRIAELNRIVHPAVIRRQDEWMAEIERNDPHAIAIVEAALIIEAGAADRFDRLIVVTCADEQRVERLAQRLKIDAEQARQEVRRRMATQLSDAEKIQKADHVIDNSGALDATEARVRQVYELLKNEVAGSQ